MVHFWGKACSVRVPTYAHCTCVVRVRYPEPLYPMISLFRNISVTANFGPDFQHAPKLDEKVQAMAHAAATANAFGKVQKKLECDPAEKKKEELCVYFETLL